jgi:uncharacterized membrane protein
MTAVAGEADRDLRRGSLPRYAANLLPSLVLLIVFDLAVVAAPTFAGRLVALSFLLFVPGAVLLSLTPLRPAELAVRVAAALGASLLLYMLLGLAYSLVLPHLGVARPLERVPLVLGINVVVLVAAFVGSRRSDPIAYLLPPAAPRWRDIAVASGLLILPLLAIVGAQRLNDGRSGLVALIAIAACAVCILGVFLAAPRLQRWQVSLALFSTTAAILLMTSMRSNYPYGYDIQSEFQVFTTTSHAGVWHVPTNGNAYAATLSITVLPTVLAAVAHISGIYIFKFAYPVMFSLFPVMTFAIAARWFDRRAATVGAVVVVVQGLYAADITGLARQEVALLYFALFIVLAFDDSLPRRTRQVAVVATGVAMAISHYSTAYFAATVLLFGYAAFGTLRLVRLLRNRHGWSWRPLRRPRARAVFSLPVLFCTVGVVILWNVTITRSAQNVGNLLSSINSSGLQLLSGAPGSSILQRFLNADVSHGTAGAAFAPIAQSYYRNNAPYLHPYPASVTARFPLQPQSVRAIVRPLPGSVASAVSTASTVVAELLLLVIAVGVLRMLWRERSTETPERSELASLGLGCLALLGVLRLSATVSNLYNAPRGQVQGAPLLGVGIALVCSWLFSREATRRSPHRPPRSRRNIRPYRARAAIGVTGTGLFLLMLTGSGLDGYILGGAAPDTIVNYGDNYQTFYFTDADIASAHWLVGHLRPGDVVYADEYGGLQLYQVRHVRGLIAAVVPQIIEPGAFVYASTTNVVDRADRSIAGNNSAEFRYPANFLAHVKNIVYTTQTTRVYR